MKNILCAFWSSYSSSGWTATRDLTLKAIWLKNIQEEYDYPSEISKQLNKFYSTKDSFKTWCKYKDIYYKWSVEFKNKYIWEKVSSHLWNLKTMFMRNEFPWTINKYRNILTHWIEDWYFKYTYIDTLWNLKEKKETLVSFLSYNNWAKITPQECSANIKVDVTISNRLEDKKELFEHLWYWGSCQIPANRWWLALWYHDMFYNWWICIILYHIWGKFEWRSLCRILHDKDWNEFMYLDRIYRNWTLTQLRDDIYNLTINKLLSLWYRVVFTDVIVDWWNKSYWWELIKRQMKEVLIGPARKTLDYNKNSYYNNWKSSAFRTSDWYTIDYLDWTYFNVNEFLNAPEEV